MIKCVILAGGLGTRLSEETVYKPKPMVEIGNKPILWHIMKLYSSYGVNDFIVCCGYKGDYIKDYFLNYHRKNSDIYLNLKNNHIKFYNNDIEDWNINLIDTGLDTMTGGRLRRVKDYVSEDELFCFTYGDGIGNINVKKSIEYHKSHKKLATMTTAFPPGRFGALNIKDNQVLKFEEKPRGDGALINGGFFVLEPRIVDYIDNDNIMFEQEPLKILTKENQLSAYFHKGFWHPMDTLRDKNTLEDLWSQGNAPWKVW